MITYSGVLKKMRTFASSPINYYLELGEEVLVMNQLINKQISIEHTHHYQCLNCNKDLFIFAQGYCKSCYFSIPQTNSSIFKPELSTAHLGIEQKNLDWEIKFELQPHVVYLAITGGLKVGVTRKTQIPTRWIDQGAMSAIVIAETENRYEAGAIEVEIAKHIADKTNYRKMLTSNEHAIDLIEKKKEIKNYFPPELQNRYVETDDITHLNFPIIALPQKIQSINFNKTNKISSRLVGIKGQYLIFEDNKVFNIRGSEGYCVNLSLLE